MPNFKDHLLFTGAGFTANYGGFLAKDMWSKIFNNPKLANAGDIKQAMRVSFDYEKLYSEIVQNLTRYPTEQVTIFKEVLYEAHLSLDLTIQEAFQHQRTQEKIKFISPFLEYFRKKDGDKIGGIFTLNHDVFLERNFQWKPYGAVFTDYGKNQVDENFSKLRLPSEAEVTTYNLSAEEYAYIKLHGSLGWTYTTNEDVIVTGINKFEAIQKIPLLKAYFQSFQDAISRNTVKLLVIGYGFRDQHINQVLANAADLGMRLIILSPENPDSFYQHLTFKWPATSAINERDENGLKIWNATLAYFPYKLVDIFGSEEHKSRRLELYEAIGISENF